MTSMGTKIDLFDIPVCNSFQDKVLHDQLCYEVDLNRFTDVTNMDREFKLGFNFILDYNEDRQVSFARKLTENEGIGLTSSIVQSNQNVDANIYLDTIGKDDENTLNVLYIMINDHHFRASYIEWRRRI